MNPLLLLRRLAYRLRGLTRRRRAESSMDDEMRHHVECEIREAVRAGVPPGEARRVALRDFGGVDRHKEAVRDARGFRHLDELARDARHALKVLRRNPGYSTAAILTFALGIGLTTAIFSVVHGVLLRPLPYTRPDRLAVVWERNPASGIERNVVSVPTFEAWRASSRSFSEMAALVPAPVTVSGTQPERVMGAEVSPDYFHLLGATPMLGRGFTAEEGTAGAASVVVLSEGFWRRRFGGDSGIVGRVISLDERPFTVIGVMASTFDPPRFGWLPDHVLWLPFVATESNRTWGRFLLVIGRLRDGTSLEAASAEAAAIATARAREAGADAGWSASAMTLSDEITGDVRRPLLVLLGAVGLLMLMAATNVGSLTLGFMRRREHELAVRRAIGASGGRIFRQLLTHSLVLGAIGSVAGFAVAIAGTRTLVALIPSSVPRAGAIRADGTVLLFSIAVAFGATVLFGVTAALRGQHGGAAAGARGRSSARLGGGSLVVAEVALGLILAALAGLMVRSFVNLRAVNLGYDPHQVIAARISLPPSVYATADRQRAFFDALGERVRASPGVRAVSFATTRPLACCAPATTVRNPAEPVRAGIAGPTVDIRYVDSSFFSALSIPLLAGSGFATRERPDGPPRVVINRSLARALWGASSPIGKTLQITLNGGLMAEVVGVAADVYLNDARTPPRGTVYLSSVQFPSTVRDIIVRADGEPDAVLGAVRGALAGVDPRLPLYLVATLTGEVERSLASDRFTTMILGLFAIVAVMLAAIGIFGVFSGEVSARKKEIGIRLALGAAGAGVMALVVRRAVRLAMVGVVLGVGGGLLAARSMTALVFGVDTTDPVSFLTVGALLLAIAVLATLVPAIRAAHVSPLDVIRND